MVQLKFSFNAYYFIGPVFSIWMHLKNSLLNLIHTSCKVVLWYVMVCNMIFYDFDTNAL